MLFLSDKNDIFPATNENEECVAALLQPGNILPAVPAVLGVDQPLWPLLQLVVSKGKQNRLKMELDLLSSFGLHVHSFTHWLRPRKPHPTPPPPFRLWAHKRGGYWSAKINDISL